MISISQDTRSLFFSLNELFRVSIHSLLPYKYVKVFLVYFLRERERVIRTIKLSILKKILFQTMSEKHQYHGFLRDILFRVDKHLYHCFINSNGMK